MQNKDYIQFNCPCCNDIIKWNEQHPSSFLCTNCSSTCIVIKKDDAFEICIDDSSSSEQIRPFMNNNNIGARVTCEIESTTIQFSISDDSTADDDAMWDILVDQIINGNVIPVVGEEIVLDNNRTVKQSIIDAICNRENINLSKYCNSECHHNSATRNSFSQLIYHPNYSKKRDSIYARISRIIEDNKSIFQPSQLLERFLSIKEFPFIITTSFDIVIENTMRRIWGARKRDVKTLIFDNDPKNTSTSGDITIASDIEYPTIYYMFGKANTNLPHRFVVTDEDMLSFCKSWLSEDHRPKVLSRIVGTKTLLFLGCNYPDWLARFIWYSLRSDLVKSGMLVGQHLEPSLEEFMQRVSIETQNNPQYVIDQIISRIEQRENKLAEVRFDNPKLHTDFFISYSRENEDSAHTLYEKLNDMGLDVWYDRKKLHLGDIWREKIKKSIETTKFFIALISDNMKNDVNESRFYRKEWNMAIEHDKGMPSKRKFIITIALDDTNINDEQLDLPDRITAGHSLIVKNDSDYDNVVNELLKLINNLSNNPSK